MLADLGVNFEGGHVPWLKQFEELKKYKALHGDCNVPAGYKENPSLGAWVNNQRTLWKKGGLDPEREQMFVDLGFKKCVKELSGTNGKEGQKGKNGKKGKADKKGSQAAKKTQQKLIEKRTAEQK